MYTKDYVEATYAVLQKGDNPKDTLALLFAYLKKRGLLKLYPRILRELLEKQINQEKNQASKLIVARTEDITRYETEIKSHTGDTETSTVILDPTIIGGFIIKIRDTYIDQSYKRKLLQTYHNVIN